MADGESTMEEDTPSREAVQSDRGSLEESSSRKIEGPSKSDVASRSSTTPRGSLKQADSNLSSASKSNRLSKIEGQNKSDIGSKSSTTPRGSLRQDSNLSSASKSNRRSKIDTRSLDGTSKHEEDTENTATPRDFPDTSHDALKTDQPTIPLDDIKQEPASITPESSTKQSIRPRSQRGCQRRLMEIIGKHELRNEELGKKEDNLRQRLELLECSMPAVMVSNIWRMAQNAPICGVRRAVEKQLKTPALCCPSTPSQHYDCRVREAEAERKEAERRAEEARCLWREKRDVLEEQRRKLEEARRIQEERKVRIKELTREARELREALEAAESSHEGFCEAGECGDAECKQRWLRKVPSTGSMRSTDVECLERLQELAEAQLSTKRQIAELERREEAYMRTLERADEIWSGVGDEAASARSSLQEQLEAKTAANRKMAERICSLEDELERLRSRMAACRAELEKYMSAERIEAAIGRDDDLASVADKIVDARTKLAHKISGREDDLARVADKGALMKQDVADKDASIRQELADKDTLAKQEALDKEAWARQELRDEETLIRQEVLDEETTARADLMEASTTAALVGEDKLVSVRPEIADLGIDRQVDLIDVEDARIGIRPEDLTEEGRKIEEARKYLAQLGSLDELYYDDDYGVCDPDFACNDQVFGPSGMDDVELAALEATGAETRPISDPAQEETLRAETAAMKPSKVATEIPDTDIIKQQPMVSPDISDKEEAKSKVEGPLAIEQDDEDKEEDSKKDDFEIDIEKEAPQIAEQVDVPVLQPSSEGEADQIQDQPDEETTVQLKEDYVIKKEIPEDQSVVADEYMDQEKVVKDTIVEKPIEVLSTVTKDPDAISKDYKVKEGSFEVPQDELLSWLDAINTIRATIAKCPDCCDTLKDANDLARGIATYTGTEIEDLVADIAHEKALPGIKEKATTEEERISSAERLKEEVKLEAEITERAEDPVETKPKAAPQVEGADRVSPPEEIPAATTKAPVEVVEFEEAHEKPGDGEQSPEAEVEIEESRIEELDVPTVEATMEDTEPATTGKTIDEPRTVDAPLDAEKKEQPEIAAQETIDDEQRAEPPKVLLKTEDREEAEVLSRIEEEKSRDEATLERRTAEEKAETRELLADEEVAGEKADVGEIKVEEMAVSEGLESREIEERALDVSPILGEVVEEEMEEVVSPEAKQVPVTEEIRGVDALEEAAPREAEAEVGESLDVARREIEKEDVKVKTETPADEVERAVIDEEVISLKTKSEEMEVEEERPVILPKIDEVKEKPVLPRKAKDEEKELVRPEITMKEIEEKVSPKEVPRIKEEILPIEEEPAKPIKKEKVFEEIPEKEATPPVTPIDEELASEPSIDSALIEAEEIRKPSARPRKLPCTCKPRVCPMQPPSVVAKRIEITQTEWIQTETVEVLTQTITSVSTQTYPAQRIVKRFDPPRSKTVSRSTDPDPGISAPQAFWRKLITDNSTVTTSTSGSQTDRSSSPLSAVEKNERRHLAHPLAVLLETLKAGQTSRGDPERELRTINYSRRPAEAEKVECDCCSCGKETSPKKRLAQKTAPISPSTFQKIQRSPRFDQETQLSRLCLDCRAKREQRSARSPTPVKPPRRKIMCDQEVCACPPEAPKPSISQPWRRSKVAKRDQSCTAKIPKAKSADSGERRGRGEWDKVSGRVEETEVGKAESTGRDSLADCICFKVVENGEGGPRRILSCACGESD